MIRTIINYIGTRMPPFKLKKEIEKQTYICKDCGGTRKFRGKKCQFCDGRGFHIK